jgi:hypothetical protein
LIPSKKGGWTQGENDPSEEKKGKKRETKKGEKKDNEN